MSQVHRTPAGMHVFVDESIHDRGHFIVVAAVCSEGDVQEQVVQSLLACGFDPSRDEFKSSMAMRDNPAAQELRQRLQLILRHCKIALAVCPIAERAILAAHLATLLSSVDLPQETHIAAIYLDEGMKRTNAEMPPGAVVTYGCDSRLVAGIQLADCAAHLVATMLLDELGVISKTVPASTVYDGQEGEIELAWTLWASIRHALSGRTPVGQVDEYGLPEPLMNPFGLVVSDRCSEDLKAAVERRLGTVWIGCIH
ncbi:DUF3800 domain-containing protein [Rhizobium lentis]|uniref:DUF3800 domain-containing protein n=1 Tax=Rhizobium lentis TaxID=1138194 RepID=A0A7W9CX37_9HYPH|nr:DUF3800 domain-containing protein [Rhizobium lentis]MBB4576013.1 hypothetical protein [Rhizobium lentis]MBB5552322.1 hypothetical protein [Rhizobium lentis]MBB5563069.1 hypothetical protein [Rhizobium lentis]MBB5569139.1 hypothetical protein [Rhizobium lentis]